MKYITEAYLINCLTNLHVGSGANDVGAVDNLVQRDPVTRVPVIHSSSLKGALREHFDTRTTVAEEVVRYVFGGDSLRRKDDKGMVGHYKFFQADLIAYPVRSNRTVFRRAVSLSQIETVCERAQRLGVWQDAASGTFDRSLFGLEGDVERLSPEKHQPMTDSSGELLESYLSTDGLVSSTSETIGGNMALFHPVDFQHLVTRLPAVARNELKNGESKNLWYEEVVPRETRFLFLVSKPAHCLTDPQHREFESQLSDCTVQIGANGSIGYGFCSIQKIVPHE